MTGAARGFSVGLIVAVAAVSGLALGWGRDESESAAIARVAVRHAREGGDGECAGRPGAGVWLVVTCGQGAERNIYRVEKDGRIAEAARGGA